MAPKGGRRSCRAQKSLINISKRTHCEPKWILTLLLDLPDLLHRLFEDGTFVRFGVEVVHVVDVGEDQLGQLFDVLVLLLPVPPLSTPLRAGGQRGKQRHRRHLHKRMNEMYQERKGRRVSE